MRLRDIIVEHEIVDVIAVDAIGPPTDLEPRQRPGRAGELFAVSRGFERKGQVVVDAEGQSEDKIMEIVLNAGADDMVNEGESFVISVATQTFADVCDALQKAGIQPISAEVGLFPLTTVPVKDVAVAKTVNKFIAALEDYDDVQNVYTNMEVDDSIASQVDEE